MVRNRALVRTPVRTPVQPRSKSLNFVHSSSHWISDDLSALEFTGVLWRRAVRFRLQELVVEVKVVTLRLRS